jgi:CheY-like chemotaxis protein
LKHLLLLAEDNPDDQFLVKRALRDFQDIQLETADDGQEALDIVQAVAPVLPALVLLDVKMPKLTGLEVLCILRSRDGMATLPIVIYSSSDEPKDVAEAERCRVTEYVLKPVDFDQYVETVQRLVRQYIGS